MRSRWLSTFTVIGVLLIGLGIVALVAKHSGHRFVFDPGQTETGNEPIFYIVVGALMVLNGVVTPAPDPDDEDDDDDREERVESRSASARR